MYIYIYHHIWGFLSPKGYQKIAGWCHRTSKNHCWMTWGYPPDLDSSIWWMAWMDESTVSTAKFSEGVLWWCLGCHVATTITESIWKGNSIFWILCSEFQKRKGRLKKNTKKQSSGLSKHRGYSNTILMGAMFFLNKWDGNWVLSEIILAPCSITVCIGYIPWTIIILYNIWFPIICPKCIITLRSPYPHCPTRSLRSLRFFWGQRADAKTRAETWGAPRIFCWPEMVFFGHPLHTLW